VVISLYVLLIYRVLRICSRCEDRFSAYVCFGVAALVFWQVTVNVGMVTGVLPVVGITLPLLSYGGSSIITLMIGVGIVAGISKRRFLFS
jgi:rod shape determining protein RodA